MTGIHPMTGLLSRDCCDGRALASPTPVVGGQMARRPARQQAKPATRQCLMTMNDDE